MAISVSCFPTLVLDHGVSYSNRKPVHILMEFQIPSKQVSLSVASHVILGCAPGNIPYVYIYIHIDITRSYVDIHTYIHIYIIDIYNWVVIWLLSTY
jgi:hypothetical protein